MFRSSPAATECYRLTKAARGCKCNRVGCRLPWGDRGARRAAGTHRKILADCRDYEYYVGAAAAARAGNLAHRAPDRGVAESVVMQIGGWKTAAMFRRYAIVSNKDKVIAMEKLEAQRVQNSHSFSHSSAAEAQTGKAIVQ